MSEREIINIVVHSGLAHLDEEISTAMLLRVAAIEGFELRVTRVRKNDRAACEAADIRLDVGGRYNPGNGDFDHHQGAGRRWWNGIPYATAGLVLRQFGELICGGRAEARIVENSLIQQIDAEDNGFSLYTKTLEFTHPVTVSQIFKDLNPNHNEPQDSDAAFWRGVEMADKMLLRRIAHASAIVHARETVFVAMAAAEASDPRIIVFNADLSKDGVGTIMSRSAAALYMVYPDNEEGVWRVKCVPRGAKSFFEQRKPLPADWAGKKGARLAEVTGVADATFCHPKCFTAGAVSREGALALAKLAADA